MQPFPLTTLLGPTEPWAVLLIGHGSLRNDSGAAMIRLAARVREAGIAPLSAAGFLNYSRPTLLDALRRLQRQGAKGVVIQPYFLIAGYFTNVALRRLLKEIAPEVPDLKLAVAEPFNAHPALAQMVIERAEAAGAAADAAVLIVAHGSPNPENNAPIHAITAQVHAAGHFAQTTLCFLGLNEPNIPDAIAAHVAAGYQQIVLVPYLLQFGGHAAEDMPAAVEAAHAAHPAATIVLAEHLGYSLHVVAAIAERVAAAKAFRITK